LLEYRTIQGYLSKQIYFFSDSFLGILHFATYVGACHIYKILEGKSRYGLSPQPSRHALRLLVSILQEERKSPITKLQSKNRSTLSKFSMPTMKSD